MTKQSSSRSHFYTHCLLPTWNRSGVAVWPRNNRLVSPSCVPSALPPSPAGLPHFPPSHNMLPTSRFYSQETPPPPSLLSLLCPCGLSLPYSTLCLYGMMGVSQVWGKHSERLLPPSSPIPSVHHTTAWTGAKYLWCAGWLLDMQRPAEMPASVSGQLLTVIELASLGTANTERK